MTSSVDAHCRGVELYARWEGGTRVGGAYIMLESDRYHFTFDKYFVPGSLYQEPGKYTTVRVVKVLSRSELSLT